jgi:hypothetical protein
MKKVADARGQELSEKEFMEHIANDEEEEGKNEEPLLIDGKCHGQADHVKK